MVPHTEYFMDYESTMDDDTAWDNDEMIDEAFSSPPSTSNNSGYHNNCQGMALFSIQQPNDIATITPPSKDMFSEELFDETSSESDDDDSSSLEELLDMPFYDFEAAADDMMTNNDISTNNSMAMAPPAMIVTPPNSGRPVYNGGEFLPSIDMMLPPAAYTAEGFASNSTTSWDNNDNTTTTTTTKIKIPTSEELNEQYLKAIARFAASMKRSEATRTEIIRQKLLVQNLNGFNAGVDSRSQLWSAMNTN